MQSTPLLRVESHTKDARAVESTPTVGTERTVVVITTTADTAEVEALLRSIGFNLVARVRQLRPKSDPATFLGRGKLDHVREALPEGPPLVSGGPPLVVANGDLRPNMLFNLEDELKVEVWDRVRLILEIFQRNARVKEARLQVELARLRYELPFVHEALHRQLTGEHPGFMGGGELAPRTYETHLKRRTRTIVKELERVKKERRTRRTGRSRSGLRSVAIAGYTNSGKSSLLNSLTGSRVRSEDRVFSTLQTATRRVRTEFRKGRPSDVLFTDTVGFIRNLPPWLVDAFASTLEETTESDAVLFVVDASETISLVEEKVGTAQGILERIHAPRRRVVALNKADLIDPGQRRRLAERLAGRLVPLDVPVLFTSTTTTEGLQDVVDALQEDVLESKEARLELDVTQAGHVRFESWLRDHAEIRGLQEEGLRRTFVVRCPLPSWGVLLSRALEAGIPVHVEGSTSN